MRHLPSKLENCYYHLALFTVGQRADPSHKVTNRFVVLFSGCYSSPPRKWTIKKTIISALANLQLFVKWLTVKVKTWAVVCYHLSQHFSHWNLWPPVAAEIQFNKAHPEWSNRKEINLLLTCLNGLAFIFLPLLCNIICQWIIWIGST